MPKKKYETPLMMSFTQSQHAWFPLAAAVGTVMGVAATTAIMKDDLSNEKMGRHLAAIEEKK